jgi:hypothetical protein
MTLDIHSTEPGANRRRFLTGAVMAGLALTGLPKLVEASGRPVFNIVNVTDNGDLSGIPGRSKDEKILNYALALETLEADLYRQALNLAAGKEPTTALDPSGNGYSLTIDPGGLSPAKTAAGFAYLVEFAAVEAAHRDFLISAISAAGGTPISPNPGGYTAPFGTDLQQILEVIRDVEETGVRAYLGVVEFISNKELRQTAGTIYSTEARHSAVINWVIGLPIGPSRERYDSVAVFDEHGDNNFEHWQTPHQILTAVKPFMA